MQGLLLTVFRSLPAVPGTVVCPSKHFLRGSTRYAESDVSEEPGLWLLTSRGILTAACHPETFWSSDLIQLGPVRSKQRSQLRYSLFAFRTT